MGLNRLRRTFILQFYSYKNSFFYQRYGFDKIQTITTNCTLNTLCLGWHLHIDVVSNHLLMLAMVPANNRVKIIFEVLFIFSVEIQYNSTNY